MLSDCIECWETPCRCGHDYRNWSDKDLRDLIAVLQKVRESKENWPDNLSTSDKEIRSLKNVVRAVRKQYQAGKLEPIEELNQAMGGVQWVLD